MEAMKIKVPTGMDKHGNVLFAYAHPFLVGAPKRSEVRVPTEIVDKTTGKVRQGFRVIDNEWMKLPLPRTQTKEMKRYANR